MKTLLCHLGLGDSILISGAAVELAKRYGHLRVPAYEHYLESVRSFYVNHPEIEVYPVDNPEGSNWGSPPIDYFKVVGDAIACGVYGPKVETIDVSWPETFYRQLGVDYAHRWDSCPIQKAWQKTGPQVLQTPKYFVHDDSERGYVITKLIPATPKACFRPVMNKGSILRYAYVLAQAQEVHVIDSAFFHLSESIDTFGQLFFHQYAREYSIPSLRDDLNVLGLPSTGMRAVRTIRHPYPTRKTWHIIT